MRRTLTLIWSVLIIGLILVLYSIYSKTILSYNTINTNINYTTRDNLHILNSNSNVYKLDLTNKKNVERHADKNNITNVSNIITNSNTNIAASRIIIESDVNVSDSQKEKILNDLENELNQLVNSLDKIEPADKNIDIQ